MTTVPNYLRIRFSSDLIWIGVAALGLVAVLPTQARPPLDPLPPPMFSFDGNSPKVLIGPLTAGDVLAFVAPDAIAIATADTFGLFVPGDDIDGLSGANGDVDPTATFALQFSVDRDTIGLAPPDPFAVAQGTPFNAQDQAWRGHAAGDQYMSLTLSTRSGKSTRFGSRGANNVLTRNNFDEGGTSFSGDPPASAQDYVGDVPEDNVDATASSSSVTSRGVLQNVYFTLTRSSPSLQSLPGSSSPSGAHIFFNPFPDPNDPAPTMLYAAHYELFLTPADDIDGLIIFDTNFNGVYDGMDQVLFSLTPDSPSLPNDPGAGANVYSVVPGQFPELFAPASEFGLGAPLDNIDALELFWCLDPLQCADVHGIQSFPGDLNCDHAITFADINAFVLALVEGQPPYQAMYPYCNWWNADCNEDGLVSFADINPFVTLVLHPPTP